MTSPARNGTPSPDHLTTTVEMLRAVTDTVEDALFVKDRQGRYLFCNAVGARQVGQPAEEVIGRDDHCLFDEADAREIRIQDERVMLTGNQEQTQRVLTTDNVTRIYRVTKSPYRDHQGSIQGVIEVARDITSRNRLEAQLQQSRKMEAIGRLAGGVAHDFNNLLTIINGYAELMLMRLPIGDRMRESVAAIQDAGESAARLNQQLLAFSCRAAVEPLILDLNSLEAQSTLLVRPLALAGKARAELDETRDAESTLTAGNSTRDPPAEPPAI